MAATDAIGKNPYLTTQNYNGVKIDIHNPVVNVSQSAQQTQQTSPNIKIYKYEEKQIPAELYPELLKQRQIQKPHPQLPSPKPVAELPNSVIPEKIHVTVPDPVYIEPKQTADIKPKIAEEDNHIQEEKKPIEKENLILETEMPANTESKAVEAATVPQTITQSKDEIVQPAKIEAIQESTLQKIKDPEETAPKQISKVEIVPPSDGTPAINYIEIAENLNSTNYDIQALQLKEIMDAGLDNNPDTIHPYIVEPIFHNIIDIVNKDTTNLSGPTEAQINIRNQIMENYKAYYAQKQQHITDDKIVLPYNISEEDKNYANKLSELELAERNKEYGIATLAVLSNAFLKEVKDETNTTVAVTDVPGLSAIVNSLKSDNYTIRLSALDALIYLQRNEYSRELTPIYEALIASDTNETVRNAAQYALDSLKAQMPQENLTQAA